MEKFVEGFAKIAIVFTAILGVLLLLIGIVLILWPNILLEALRYGIAGICIVGAIVCLVQFYIALSRINKRHEKVAS